MYLENFYKKIKFFTSSWRRVTMLCLSILFFLIIHESLSALISNCRASTTFPNGTHEGVAFRISSTTNGMLGISLPNPLWIICTNEGNFGTMIYSTSTGGCSANELPLFRVSTTSLSTPSHVEDPSLGNYIALHCLQYDTSLFNYATITSQLNNCNGYGTTLFSAPAYFTTTGNAHIGDANAYPMKRCMTLQFAQSIGITFSSQTVGFGTLSSSQTRYATSDGLGTTTPFTATSSSFYITVNVIGNSNYSVALSGATLTNQNATTTTIAKIGGTPAVLTSGIDQFGISGLTECLNPNSYGCVNSGATTTILYPYNTANYAYAGDANVSTQFGTGPQDDGYTTYGGSRFYFRLGANIAPLTPPGDYSTGLTVIVTPQF